MTFDSLGLRAELVRAVTELGYTTPTPIQAQAIPAVLAGGDLLAGAQTGTGKTAGFTLPLLQRLTTTEPAFPPKAGRVRALVLTPTRELAAQVEESVRQYGKYTKITSMVMFGGVGMNPQVEALKKRVDVLVATPGRLLDHAGQRTVDLSGVEILILDEADRMLDMGFIHDIKKVLALLPPKRQNLLFSATFADEIRALADKLLDRPALIEVARRNATADLIAQRVVMVDRDGKRALLTHLVKSGDWKQVLVFTRTKHGANRLVEHLLDDGVSAMAIHGNKSQTARTKALSEFKDGSLRVLVATDIAARGIDISELPHVVNYELPNVSEDYVHRIGRTGRAGAEGEAVSLVCVDEIDFLEDIEKLIKRKLPRETVPGHAFDASVTPEPIVLGRRQVIGRRGAGTDAAVKAQRDRIRREEQGRQAPRGGASRGPAPAGGRTQDGAARGGQPARPGAGVQASRGASGSQGGRGTQGGQPAARPAQPGSRNGSGQPRRDGGQPRRDGQAAPRRDDGRRAPQGGAPRGPRTDAHVARPREEGAAVAVAERAPAAPASGGALAKLASFFKR